VNDYSFFEYRRKEERKQNSVQKSRSPPRLPDWTAYPAFLVSALLNCMQCNAVRQAARSISNRFAEAGAWLAVGACFRQQEALWSRRLGPRICSAPCGNRPIFANQTNSTIYVNAPLPPSFTPSLPLFIPLSPPRNSARHESFAGDSGGHRHRHHRCRTYCHAILGWAVRTRKALPGGLIPNHPSLPLPPPPN